MQTIDIYLRDENERKRKSRSAFAILAAAVIGVVALAARPPEKPAPAPAPPPKPVVVYVDRPVLVPPEPVASPPAAKPAEDLPAKPEPPKPKPQPKPVQTKPASPPPQPKVVETIAPAPEPPPPPQVNPAPRRFPLVIEPRSIYFARRGKQRITFTNPHPAFITVKHVQMVSVEGSSLEDYSLDGVERCLKTLEPGESCRFNVVSRGQKGGIALRVFYDSVAQ